LDPYPDPHGSDPELEVLDPASDPELNLNPNKNYSKRSNIIVKPIPGISNYDVKT
jgi:hypothetical protein